MKTEKQTPPRTADEQAPASLPAWNWHQQGAWRLPSGQPLVEFALRSGFVAPRLLSPDRAAGREEELRDGAEDAAAARECVQEGQG